MFNMAHCKYCYHPLENNARFCSSCGKPQSDFTQVPFDTDMQETPALRCRRCGGTHIKVELRSAGTTSTTNYYRTGAKNSILFPSNQRTHNSQRNYKSIAFCQDCGDYWEIVSSDELRMIEQGKRYLKRIGIVLLCLFVFLFISSFADSDTTDPSKIWASEYTPLSDFEYYIDGGKIYLKDYKGASKKVYIAPQYTVNNCIFHVVSLDGTFALENVDSVIVPEGVKQISNNAFNSCGITHLYLPSTVNHFEGWSYFHDMEKIYYGGSQNAWNDLCQYERSRLDVVEIVYNSDITDLLTK